MHHAAHDNLSFERSQPDVWSRMDSDRQRSNAIRLVTAAGALALFVFARRRTALVVRTLGLLGAAALARQALTCDGVSRVVSKFTGIPMPACDESQPGIDEAGMESFPASDPSSTATTSTAKL